VSDKYIYVLETISQEEAKKTQDSIIRYNPSCNVIIAKNPCGFQGTDGALAIPEYHGDCTSNILIVTDQMTCNANLDCVMLSNSSLKDSLNLTLNFSHNKNICWYRFDGLDDFDSCYLLNMKNLNYIKSQNLASGMFSDNCDFGNLFSYKNKKERPTETKIKKKKRRWWFGK